MMSATIKGVSTSVKDVESDRGRSGDESGFAAMLTPPPSVSPSTSASTQRAASESSARQTPESPTSITRQSAESSSEDRDQGSTTATKKDSRALADPSSEPSLIFGHRRATAGLTREGVAETMQTRLARGATFDSARGGAGVRTQPGERAQAVERSLLPSLKSDDPGARLKPTPLAASALLGASAAESGTGATNTTTISALSGALASPVSANAGAASPMTGGAMGTSALGVAVSVHAPVGSGSWSNELGDRILTVLRADVGEAVINLAPEELGPVKVSLNVQDGEVRLQWIAQAAETRLALEQAAPRLRELLAQQGLHLADSQVSADSAKQSFANQSNESDHSAKSALARDALRGIHAERSESEPTTVLTAHRRGLLDTYA